MSIKTSKELSRLLFAFLLFFCIGWLARAELLQTHGLLEQRISHLAPTVEDLFYQARNEFDESALKAGQSYFWIRYGKKAHISRSAYQGYVLYADPYHVAQKKITFLMGSDCSHFVHRFLQLMGANYSYAKTRHFLDWAERGQIREWNECRNKEFGENFMTFSNLSAIALKLGDLLVWPRARGERGVSGHVAIVTSLSPLIVLHAKNHRVGIVQEVLNAEQLEGAKAFRWIGELAYKETLSLATLLEKDWQRDPSRCAR